MIAYAMIYLKRLDDKGGIILTYGIAILVIIFLILFIIAAKTCYVKAPPNVAYIISGLTKNPRILIGIGGFKIPLLERVDMLYLGQMSVDIKTSRAFPPMTLSMLRLMQLLRLSLIRKTVSTWRQETF